MSEMLEVSMTINKQIQDLEKGNWIYSSGYGFNKPKMHFLEREKNKCLCNWQPNFQYNINKIVKRRCKICFKKLKSLLGKR